MSYLQPPPTLSPRELSALRGIDREAEQQQQEEEEDARARRRAYHTPRCQQASRTPPFAAPLGTSSQACPQSLEQHPPKTGGKSAQPVQNVRIFFDYSSAELIAGDRCRVCVCVCETYQTRPVALLEPRWPGQSPPA